MSNKVVRLYHGSDMAIEQPDISMNSGNSDLGQGFYLTDDHTAAMRRASSRARRQGAPVGVVTVFDLDFTGLAWVSAKEASDKTEFAWVSAHNASNIDLNQPFVLGFEGSCAGLIAWMNYISACRQGHTAIGELGDPAIDPAIVRAWIATEEVEMACSGFIDPSDLVELIDPASLIVQYCLRDQQIANDRLTFVCSEEVPLT